MDEKKSFTEEFKVTGDKLLSRIKELLHEGSIRHITIKNKEDRTLIEFPLTFGVVGVLLAPTAAAVGALAALVTNCTIVVTKEISEE